MSGRDRRCTDFLRWALPRAGLRWKPYRRVRGQVCRRLEQRIGELGLRGFEAYRGQLDRDPDEWRELEHRCRVTISRFLRHRESWTPLASVLEALAEAAEEDERPLRAWSVGCASGEEPYSLALLWRRQIVPHAGVEVGRLRIHATDVDPTLLARARRAVYPVSSLEELPQTWREAAFDSVEGGHRLTTAYRHHVGLAAEDLVRPATRGPFDLVLCRNLAFTYYDEERRRATARRLSTRLRPGGLLFVAPDDDLPEIAELEREVSTLWRKRDRES